MSGARIKYYLGSILSFCFVLMAAGHAFAYKDGDGQYWNTESVSFKLTEKIGVYIEEEFRFGEGMSEFYYQHSQVQLDFKISDWFVLSPAYRQTFELYTKSDGDEGWFREYQPMVNALLQHKWQGWSFSDRVRFSYRMFNIDREDLWRVRNKITVKSPCKWTPLEIKPWVSDEIFFEEHKTGVYRNRLYAGVEMKLTKHLKGDIFYLWQATESDSGWMDINVLGTKLKVEF